MKTSFLKIIKKPFVRDVTTVASGMTIAQVVVIGFAPIITRLYGPEAFGVLGVFAAIVAVITPISTLTYAIAIVLPEKDSEALDVAKLALGISLILTLFLALLLSFFNEQIINVLQIQQISAYLLLIPLVLLSSAVTNVLHQWMIRKGQFKTKAKVTVAQSVIVNATKSGIGIYFPTATTLIIISTLGHVLHAALLGAGIKKTDREALNPENSLRQKKLNHYITIARKYKKFPVFRMPQTLINSVTQGTPVIMLAAFFGPAAAGFYSLGLRVLKRPSSLIGKSIGNVFYPRIAKAANAGEELNYYIKRVTFAMAAFVLLPFSIIFFLDRRYLDSYLGMNGLWEVNMPGGFLFYSFLNLSFIQVKTR